MSAAPDTLILGTRKGLLLLKCEGKRWVLLRESFLGIPVSYAAVDRRTGTLWTCLGHGHWGQKLHRSRDMGASWEEVATPKYPEGAVMENGQPATLRYLWVVAPGGYDQPRRLYVGTEPGGLFRSDDGGLSFELVEGLWNHPSRMEHWFGGGRAHPGIHSIIVDPRDSRRVLVAVSCAGVFETCDDGLTWAPRNKGIRSSFLPDPESEVGHDPHLMLACAANPDVLWQQNHSGIYRSTDGGRSWQDVSQPDGPALFGYTIAVDPQDPQSAWVVPAVSDEVRVAINGALCVCRTQDGGRSWQAFRSGLPQQLCYDVVYRHACDYLNGCLAFGTTTGNLFISDDRGETWQSLGHYYPPIASVRFAPTV